MPLHYPSRAVLACCRKHIRTSQRPLQSRSTSQHRYTLSGVPRGGTLPYRLNQSCLCEMKNSHSGSGMRGNRPVFNTTFPTYFEFSDLIGLGHCLTRISLSRECHGAYLPSLEQKNRYTTLPLLVFESSYFVNVPSRSVMSTFSCSIRRLD